MAKKDDSDSKLFAFLGVFLTVIGFVIVYATKKDDDYAMYYGRQGLALFIAWVVAWIVMLIFAFIPVIGWLIDIILWIVLLILWIIGIIYALSGEKKDIPVIGSIAKLLKF